MPPRYDPVSFAHEIITVADSVIALTPATYLDALHAEITVEVAEIRYWDDGGDPTASEGHAVDEHDIIILDTDAAIENFKAIRTGGTSGVLMVSYFH